MNTNQTKEKELENASARKFNFRPLFYGCLAFGIGISFSYFIFSLDLAYLLLLGLGVVFVVGLCVLKKLFVNLLVIVACFVGGVGAYFLETKRLTAQITCGQTYLVEGRVGTQVFEKEQTTFLVLYDVTLDGKKTANLTLSVYTVGNNFTAEPGQNLRFTAEIYDQFLFENNLFNSYAYKMNATHSAFVEGTDVHIIGVGNLNIAERVRLWVKNLLHAHMPFETAELSYSILFGDQTQLDEDIKQSFATSGLGHLVAVSGLNIAVLVACLYWLLRLFKTPQLPKFLIVSAILLVYCYLCSFAPSVVRASIMAVVFLASTLLARQYDLLSSLGLAGFVILIFTPFAVFDAGFLMSFVSVLAIGILAGPITKIFNQKCKIPKTIANALAIDICTTLAILPILAFYFGQISFFSWLTNLICVPIFSASYILVFALVFVVGVFGFMGFLLLIPSLMMQFIIWFASFIASLDFAIIFLHSLSIIGLVAFYVCLILWGNIYMSSSLQKVVSSAMAVVAAVILVIGFDRPNTPSSTTYAQLNSFTPSLVLTSNGGQILVLSGAENKFLDEYLMHKRIQKITTFVTYDQTTEATKQIVEKYSPQNTISATNGLSRFGDFQVEFINQNKNLKAIYVEADGVGALVAVERIGATQAQNIRTKLASYDIDILFQARQTLNFLSVHTFEYVFSADALAGLSNNYATKLCGTFAFSATNGIIGEIRSEN